MSIRHLSICTLAIILSFSATAKEKENGGGTVTGILVKKSEKSISVKIDGEKEPREFRPRWIGGNPKDGGGMDKKVVAAIKELYPSNLVKLEWIMEEGPRVVHIEMLEPKAKSGTITGVIVGKGKGYIELKPENGPTERYVPHWKGGMPKDGGGLDKDMLAAIKKAKVGKSATIDWEYSERKRLVSLKQ